MVFDWPKNGPPNQTDQKKSSAETSGTNETSRTEAKERGEGEVNLPPGLEGSEDQVGKERI